MFRRHVLPWIAFLFFRLWSATWRLHVVESEGMKQAVQNGETLIFAHWHGDELKVLPLIRPYRIATMTSTSKDGELMDFAIRKFGGATSRGSSTGGGIGALKGLIRPLGRGHNASIAVDGPKGPLHKVKPGVFELSRLAKARIVPVGAAASNAIVFRKSWNKAGLPKPFSKVTVWFDEPFPALNREESAKEYERALRLERAISKACQEAASHLR